MSFSSAQGADGLSASFFCLAHFLSLLPRCFFPVTTVSLAEGQCRPCPKTCLSLECPPESESEKIPFEPLGSSGGTDERDCSSGHSRHIVRVAGVISSEEDDADF